MSRASARALLSLVGSAALHSAIAGLALSGAAARPVPPPRELMVSPDVAPEYREVLPPPDPAPPQEAPSPAGSPPNPLVNTTRKNAAPSAQRAAHPEPPPPAPEADALPEAPLELGLQSDLALGVTSQVEGPRGAAPSGALLGGQPRSNRAPRSKPPLKAPSPPAYVPPAELSARPRAPALDHVLVQHYPPAAKAQGLSGEATVEVRISPAGAAQVTRVLSESASGFGAACRRTVHGSAWSPPLDAQGRAVGTRLSYRCRFRVDRAVN